MSEGLVIGGRYRLLSRLGEGGMGSVWRAEHITLHTPLAVKLMDAQIVGHPDAVARFVREAQAAAALRSPNVVQVFDVAVDQGQPYIAMELLEGETLRERIARRGRLTGQETMWILSQVGRAVARAHDAGIIHRDLKPDNIFLALADGQELVKVLDFGAAKTTAFGPVGELGTRTGAFLGTPYYMSPEQIEGARTVDFRTDIWALGVIAFECLTGSRPFNAPTLARLITAICEGPMPVPSQVGPVPDGFDAWFARSIARDVDERFASAQDALQELGQLCGVHALPAPFDRTVFSTPPAGHTAGPATARSASPVSLSGRPAPQPPSRQRRLAWISGAAGIAALVSVGLYASLIPHRATSSPPSAAAGPAPSSSSRSGTTPSSSAKPMSQTSGESATGPSLAATAAPSSDIEDAGPSAADAGRSSPDAGREPAAAPTPSAGPTPRSARPLRTLPSKAADASTNKARESKPRTRPVRRPKQADDVLGI